VSDRIQTLTVEDRERLKDAASDLARRSLDADSSQFWRRVETALSQPEPLDAEIQRPGKVFVWHGDDKTVNEGPIGEWMDGEQVNALIRKLKSAPSPEEIGRLRELREKQLDCGVCGVPETVMVPVGQCGYAVPRCKDHRKQPPYQTEARLRSLLAPAPSDSQGDQELDEVRVCPKCGTRDGICGHGMELVPHPENMQGDQERCKRCGGKREIDHYTAGRLTWRPCWECNGTGKKQPEPGGEEDWQEGVTTHDLKCWPPYFEDIVTGRKNFECRAADRDYKAGDLLRLREFDPEKGYTGRELTERVTYVLHGNQFGIEPGHVVMSLYKPVVPATSQDSSRAIADELYRMQGAYEKAQAGRLRAETALEELLEDFTYEATTVGEPAAPIWKRAAERAREKAAQLKEGERDGDH